MATVQFPLCLFLFFSAAAVFLLAFSPPSVNAASVEHTFHVRNLSIRRLCRTHIITAVNGQYPGPTLRVRDGDSVAVHVINDSPYNISIHWHGIFQLLTAWADGPSYVTQCPIVPGTKYTYRFNITGQEGTLWWHAHVSMLRATVHGALIIRPAHGVKYPFPKPREEVPIILGEWWNANVVDMEEEARATGVPVNISDAFTINGKPGDLYPCSNNHSTYKLKVKQGKTYMLRIINAALNTQLFFKIAGHNLTVVAADARYTVPYCTDVIAVAPGQTVDALMLTDAAPGRYYMAAQAFVSASVPVSFANTTGTGIVEYTSIKYFPDALKKTPAMPSLPEFNDTVAAHKFYMSLLGLRNERYAPVVPSRVDEHMFITIGFGVLPCRSDQPRCDRTRGILAGTMNNISLELPTKLSLLEAHFNGVTGVYSPDFPNTPPAFFNFTNEKLSLNPALLLTSRGTRVKKLKYNATVEVVLQNTAVIGAENHPIHLHGFDFFVLAQGLGNYNYIEGMKRFNLVNPHMRNTVGVPAGGWTVIRFVANNPGVWIMHCHLDAHLSSGLATAFLIENGDNLQSTLPPPPLDYPNCP